MTLDKHTIQGITKIKSRVLPASEFENIMQESGYVVIGFSDAKGGRKKKWWGHDIFPRVEVIYSPDLNIVITAYEVTEK